MKRPKRFASSTSSIAHVDEFICDAETSLLLFSFQFKQENSGKKTFKVISLISLARIFTNTK